MKKGYIMNGFFNRLLQIDLGQKCSEDQSLQDELLAETLGGKGLASHILLNENPPNVDPLSPENRLIFALGPVSGTTAWGECRYGVTPNHHIQAFTPNPMPVVKHLILCPKPDMTLLFYMVHLIDRFGSRLPKIASSSTTPMTCREPRPLKPKSRLKNGSRKTAPKVPGAVSCVLGRPVKIWCLVQ